MAEMKNVYRMISAALVVGSLSFSGCAAIEVAIGLRVHLDQMPITSLSASLANASAIAPGQKLPLIVTLTEANGDILRTEGAGKGKVFWTDLQLTPTLVTVDKKGVLSLRKDPRFSDRKVGHVVVTVPSHPDLKTELDVPVGYQYPFVSNFSGALGSSGMSGSDGSSGMSGYSGSTDPNNPSAGSDGSNGGDGSDGQDGGPGGDAPAVNVQVTLRPGTPPLLQALVSAANHQRRYLVDPRGGSLTVKADGGPGGSGGRGGRGGSGGSGGSGSPSGSSGSSGRDGRNGFDGDPGRGGPILLIYDPKAEPFLNAIHLSSSNGPPPVMKQQPIALLW